MSAPVTKGPLYPLFVKTRDEILKLIADAEERGRVAGLNEAADLLSQGMDKGPCVHAESWREVHRRREMVLDAIARISGDAREAT